MLKEGVKFYEVGNNLTIKEYIIIPHRSHDFSDQYGKIVIEPSDKTATAKVKNLATGQIRDAVFVSEMECKKVEELLQKKLYEHTETTFGRLYRDKAYAIEWYNHLIDREIERLEKQKL